MPKIYYPGDEVSVVCQSLKQHFVGNDGAILPVHFIVTCSHEMVDPVWLFNGIRLPEHSACLSSEYMLKLILIQGK